MGGNLMKIYVLPAFRQNAAKIIMCGFAIALLTGISKRAFAGECAALFNVPITHWSTEIRTFEMKPAMIHRAQVLPAHQLSQSLHLIRDRISTLIPARYSARRFDQTVFYPMSGFDLATPLTLFPNADNYILVDNHSLMKPQDIESVVRTPLKPDFIDHNKSWVKYDQTGNDIFPQLITSLFATFPSAKIRSIQFLVDARENVSLKLQFHDSAQLDDSKMKTLYYLVGEVGYLNSEAWRSAERQRAYDPDRRASFPSGTNWWDEMVAAMAPRTFILKGSMSALRATVYEQPLPGRERILKSILKSGGIIVEGSSYMTSGQDAKWAQSLDPHRPRWELTDGDMRFARPVANAVLKNVEFSYSRKVHIAVFDFKPRGQSPSEF